MFKEQKVVMDFTWDHKQQEYKSTVIRFAQKELCQG